MVFTNKSEKGEKIRWYQRAFGKLLLCLAVTLLSIGLMPFVSQAATLELGGNLGQSPGTVTETDIRAGKVSASNITLTLTLIGGNTWASDVISDAGKFNTLKAGFSSLSEESQWNTIKNTLSSSDFTLSGNKITVIIPAVTGYDITTDQEISVKVAPSLLSDASDSVTNAPVFTIIADCQATLTTNLKSSVDIISGGNNISISLTNAAWNPEVINIAARRDQFFNSFTSGSENNEWKKVIDTLKASPDPATVLLLSNENRTLTIVLPPVPDYQISTSQTITADYSKWTQPGFISGSLTVAQPVLTLNIMPSVTTAKLAGTLITTSPTEKDVMTGGKTIVITLANNTWQNELDSNHTNPSQAKVNELVNSFSTNSDNQSWERVKKALKDTAIQDKRIQIDATKKVLTITLPPVSGYDIAIDQTINVNIPATLLQYNYPVTISPNSFIVKAEGAAVVSGTVAPLLTEADMISGGKTIIITLTNHTWIPDVTSNATNRNILMAGFMVTKGTPKDTSEWSKAVDVIKASGTFTRISDITVSITLPKGSDFNIENELEIRLTVMGNLISSPGPAPAPPLAQVEAFTIIPVSNQSAQLSGSALSGIIENDIIAGGKAIEITLSNDTWASDVATNATKRNGLLDGLVASGVAADVTAWTNAIGTIKTKANSDSTVVVRNSDTVLTITLPACAGFILSDDLNINISIPVTAVTTASAPIQVTSFKLAAITATVSGTAITAPTDSSSIIAGGKTVIITLKNAVWVADVASRYSALLNNASSNYPADWNTIKNKITAADVVRTSNTVVTIKLPPVPNYSGSNEIITFSIPAALIKDGNKLVTATPNLQIGSMASATLSIDTNRLYKSNIVYGGDKITITLKDCTWVADVVSNVSKLKTLLKGFTADSDATNWNLVVTAMQNNLNNVELISDQKLSIKIPSVPNYDPVNEQNISLTIPKNLLVSAGDNVIAKNQIVINLPSYYYQGTLQYLLDYNILSTYINTKPLQDIYLTVPVKYITSVVVGQTKLDNTVITSMDIYTDSNVNKVSVIVNGSVYTTRDWVSDGKGNKFNIGFAYNESAASDSIAEIDAIISVSDRNIRLQNDLTIKINGSQTHSFVSKTDLKGTYSLHKLVNDSKLFTSILDYYIPADIKMQTVTP